MVKFRSWNGMFTMFIYFKDGHYFVNKDCKIEHLIKFPMDFIVSDFWQNKEQSLELFDKNKKEIFEGDVIQFQDSALEMAGNDESAFDFINKATVVKKDFYFTLENFLSKDEDTGVYNRLDEIEYLEELKELFEYSEVIGNIHENKEIEN